MSEIAHLGPVELLTPRAQESLDFFADVLGMEVEATEGRSVYLRGWGDYQRFSLKLTEAATSGMAVLGLRAAAGRRIASATPTGTPSSCTSRRSATRRPSTCGRR